MSDDGEIVESLLNEKGLRQSGAVWADDWILSRILKPLGNKAIAVSALANPLRIISTPDVTIVPFDYAYFLFLRDLCRSLQYKGDTAGALIALYQFEIGYQLDCIGLAEEAAGLLRSACELRSSFAVYPASTINEMLLYELAVNVCIAHEKAHEFFAEDATGRKGWLQEARGFLTHLNNDAPRMFSDVRVKDDVQTTIATFVASEGLPEGLLRLPDWWFKKLKMVVCKA